MRTGTVRIPVEFIEEIDELVRETKAWTSRNEFVRDAVRRLLENYKRTVLEGNQL